MTEISNARSEPWSLTAGRVIPGLRHRMTTMDGPDLRSDPGSKEHAVLVTELAADAGLDGVAWARQVHGGTVLRVEAAGCVGEADALWTDVSGLGVLGRSADCPIVLVAGVADDGRRLWGMAHASWRSTVAGITTSLLEAMIGERMNPRTALAAIAPSAGPCCYEVGTEVREAFLDQVGVHAGSFFRETGLRPRLDLWAANVDALARGGIAPGRVTVDARCSICGIGFWSYRRDGDGAGRMGVVVGVG